jgi:hypothetical protein
MRSMNQYQTVANDAPLCTIMHRDAPMRSEHESSPGVARNLADLRCLFDCASEGRSAQNRLNMRIIASVSKE